MNMSTFTLFWLIGWVIMSIGTYVYNVYIDNDNFLNKKANIWRAFCFGICSWIGIMFCLCFGLSGLIFISYEYIENKLNHI